MQRYFVLFFILLLTACSGHKKTSSTPRPRPQSTTANSKKPKPETPTLPTTATEGNIQWVESEFLMPVLEEAQQLHKPVFISFHASWCAPCKVMEEEIFTLPQVYNYVNQHFINFHADFDAPSGKRIAEIFEVTQLPTILFVNGNGVALERYTGIISAAEMERLGNAALAKK